MAEITQDHFSWVLSLDVRQASTLVMLTIIFLSKYSDGKYVAEHLSLDEVAAASKCSRSTVQRAINDLEKKGLIERVKYYGNSSNTYVILPKSVATDWYKAKIIKQSKAKRPEIKEKDRWEIFERDDFSCQLCGARRNLVIDHIIPLAKGGANDVQNYQTLCESCNLSKLDKLNYS